MPLPAARMYMCTYVYSHCAKDCAAIACVTMHAMTKLPGPKILQGRSGLSSSISIWPAPMRSESFLHASSATSGWQGVGCLLESPNFPLESYQQSHRLSTCIRLSACEAYGLSTYMLQTLYGDQTIIYNSIANQDLGNHQANLTNSMESLHDICREPTHEQFHRPVNLTRLMLLQESAPGSPQLWAQSSS